MNRLSRVVGVCVLAALLGCGSMMGWSVAADQPASRKVEIVAHRGASHDAPENTLPAIELGWEQGADVVEIDVYLSKDGEVVLLHDKTTKRTTGVDKPIADQTWAELSTQDAGSWKAAKYAGTKLPRLADALATIPAGKRMLVEVKCGPEIVPHLKREFAKSGQPVEAIVVICFQEAVCAAVRKELPEHKVYYLASIKQEKSTGEWLPTAASIIATAKELGVQGVDLSACEAIDAAFVKQVKAAGLEMHVWTVDKPEVARAMQAAGVDSLTTNRPAYLREALTK